eukprot:2007676-Amphidinium_carterae.1
MMLCCSTNDVSFAALSDARPLPLCVELHGLHRYVSCPSPWVLCVHQKSGCEAKPQEQIRAGLGRPLIVFVSCSCGLVRSPSGLHVLALRKHHTPQ